MMKVFTKILFTALCLGTIVTFITCNDNDPADSPLDPNVFCDENLCSTDSDLKKDCIDAFNDCIKNNPDVNDDECAATALLICKL